tara:strand:- start:263 stop:832 length:570 start_codon:yes stop_codon:yes gene_type:complete
LQNVSGLPGEDPGRKIQTLASYKFDVHSNARAAASAANDLVNGAGNPWLVLSGPKGAGKTHIARAIGYELLAQQFSVLYHRAGDLETLMRATQRPNAPVDMADLSKGLADVNALIIDDCWATVSTEWALGQLENILDQRYESMALTVITTNLPPAEIRKMSGRLFSRMADQSISTWVDMVGVPDYRLKR